MVIRDIDAVLGEALAQSLVEVIARIPVIGDGCPAADSVFNGVVTVGGEENIGRRLVQYANGGGHSIQTRIFYGLGGGIIRCADSQDDTAAAKRGIIDDLGAGEAAVRQEDDLPVGGLDARMVEGDVPDGADSAVRLDNIADGKGMSRENDEPAGDIAHYILRGEGQTQGEHRGDGRDGRGVQP